MASGCSNSLQLVKGCQSQYDYLAWLHVLSRDMEVKELMGVDQNVFTVNFQMHCTHECVSRFLRFPQILHVRTIIR